MQVTNLSSPDGKYPPSLWELTRASHELHRRSDKSVFPLPLNTALVNQSITKQRVNYLVVDFLK